MRIVEGSPHVALLCRHELLGEGVVSLVRAGIGARSEPPFWSAPLASPFEAVATLSEEAMAEASPAGSKSDLLDWLAQTWKIEVGPA